MSLPRITWLSHPAWAEGEHLILEGDGQLHRRVRDADGDLAGTTPVGHVARVDPDDVPPEARAELAELRAAWLDAPSREDLHAEWEATYRRGLGRPQAGAP